MLTLPPYEGRERIIHIHEDIYCTILFWVEEFSGFQCAKTSVNKRLLCNSLFYTVEPSALRFNVRERGREVMLTQYVSFVVL